MSVLVPMFTLQEFIKSGPKERTYNSECGYV